ncbi:MAG TPA: AIR synthase related protein [Actinomycetota bacterium]
MTTLDEIVRRYREHPGLGAKRPLRIVREALGPSDAVTGPGDDAAAIKHGDGHLLVAGEAMWPPFAEADPFGAGAAAVVANVNDVAAMGGRPLAIVDTIVGPEEDARRALEGMGWAADLYGVPVVGGHLTVAKGPPSISAFVAGRARTLLSATRVAPGQVLLVACCREGRMREDFPFFSSLRERGERLRDDVAVLADVAEGDLAEAAKDVSMAGFLGSLAMLLEPTRAGATVDLDAMPRPEGVANEDWAGAFPTYGFWLTARPEAAEDCRDAFLSRGLASELVGELDDTGVLRVRFAGEVGDLADLARDPPTGL